MAWTLPYQPEPLFARCSLHLPVTSLGVAHRILIQQDVFLEEFSTAALRFPAERLLRRVHSRKRIAAVKHDCDQMVGSVHTQKSLQQGDIATLAFPLAPHKDSLALSNRLTCHAYYPRLGTAP